MKLNISKKKKTPSALYFVIIAKETIFKSHERFISYYKNVFISQSLPIFVKKLF